MVTHTFTADLGSLVDGDLTSPNGTRARAYLTPVGGAATSGTDSLIGSAELTLDVDDALSATVPEGAYVFSARYYDPVQRQMADWASPTFLLDADKDLSDVLTEAQAYAPTRGALDHGNVSGPVTLAAQYGIHEMALVGNTTATPSGPAGSDLTLRVTRNGYSLSLAGATWDGGEPEEFPEPATISFLRFPVGGWVAFSVGTVVDITPGPVVPVAPTFVDLSGTGDDTYTIPTTLGVQYQVGAVGFEVDVAGGIYAGLGTVRITAVPEVGGWSIVGTDEWSFTFDATVVASHPTIAVEDQFNRANGLLNGSTADSGQTWLGSAFNTSIASNRLVPNIKNAIISHGAVTDHTLWGKGICADNFRLNTKSTLTTDIDTTPTLLGIKATYQAGTPRLIVEMTNTTGLTLSYNLNRPLTDFFAVIPGGTDTSEHIYQMQIVGSDITVFVDGARLMQGTYTSMAAFSGSSLVVRGSGVAGTSLDYVKVMKP